MHSCVCVCAQPMKVQADSFEERSESPDLPEPLYEEVGDFGLQVLKSLETSFLSSSAAETQEVPDHPGLRLVPVETEHLGTVLVSDQSGCVEAEEQSAGGGAGGEAASRGQQLQGVCTPSQELLLQELSSAFTKKEEVGGEGEEVEEEEERPYDV